MKRSIPLLSVLAAMVVCAWGASAQNQWVVFEGKDGPGGYRDPLVQWTTDEASPSGIAVVGGHAFLGALRGECVWSVDLASGRSRRWLEGHGRIRLVAAAPDGSLWVGTSNKDGRGSPSADDDRIFRVTL